MSRWSDFGVLFVIVVALQAGQLVAQNDAAGRRTALTSIVVRNVVVRGAGDAIEVEIQTSGAPVSPDTQAITGPDRIVVDFPGARPSGGLRALKLSRGALKGVRSGLFFDNPPITRVVLDLAEPLPYRISTLENRVVVKLGQAATVPKQHESSSPHLEAASLPIGASVSTARLSTTNAAAAPISDTTVADSSPQQPPAPQPPAAASETRGPALTVTYDDGLLYIHASKVTLAQVLYEIHLQTQADIPIPAGAEQEQVVADLGPAPPRDVLAALLNGSPYNFVFVGGERSLERVILTRRDPGSF